jgi:putative sigma-54 modulation protein
MEINVQFVKMETSEFMIGFAIKKLRKLGKRFNTIIKSEVFYKLENDPKGKGKICEIQLSLSGPRIFAISNEESFQTATDETINDLEKQLEKRKSKQKPYV